MENINKNKISKKSPSPPLIKGEVFALVVDFFKRGKVVVYPTDTIYGIGCAATNKKAIERIYKIKKREKKKPLLVLVSSLAMVKKYCRINKEQEEYLKKLWGKNKKPTTVLLNSKKILPKELTGEENILAVRLPKNEFLVEIIKKIKYPIISTSANISGWKYDGDPEKIKKIFRNKIDLFVDAGELKGKPSMLVDLRAVDDIKVLRK